MLVPLKSLYTFLELIFSCDKVCMMIEFGFDNRLGSCVRAVLAFEAVKEVKNG